MYQWQDKTASLMADYILNSLLSQIACMSFSLGSLMVRGLKRLD